MSNYRQATMEDADATAMNFLDEIIEQLIEKGKASDDLYNDYPDGDVWHHECHVDQAYRLTEAAELLDDLSEYEETDSGLWEGMLPREAISVQAAFTYGNAVMSRWQDLIAEINDQFDCWNDDWDAEADGQIEDLSNAEQEASMDGRDARKVKDVRSYVTQWIEDY